MPFLQDKQIITGLNSRDFAQIDKVIIQTVCPHLRWEQIDEGLKRVVIYPNGHPDAYPLDSRPVDERVYLSLVCKMAGLDLGEVGFWLDVCSSAYRFTHTDGITRLVSASQDSTQLFDEAKPIYFSNNIPRRYMIIDDRR